MQARDIMCSPVVSVSRDATVDQTVRLLLDRKINGAPVTDDLGKLAGIVTKSDLMRRVEAGTDGRYSWRDHVLAGDRALAAAYVRSHTTRIREIMTPRVHTVDPDTPLSKVVGLLEMHRIRSIPVIDTDRSIVGIISRTDILRAIVMAHATSASRPSDDQILERLTGELKLQLWSNPERVSFDVKDGVVGLHGVVRSDEERRAVRAMAEAVPGVREIRDSLTIRPTAVP